MFYFINKISDILLQGFNSIFKKKFEFYAISFKFLFKIWNKI